MRQRTGEGVKKAAATKQSTSEPLTERFAKLERFDIYRKVNDEVQIQTRSGGVLSLVALFLTTMMFITELNIYLSVERTHHIIIDTTDNLKLPIGVNLTFPRLRCDEIAVNVVDSRDENQVNVVGGLDKVNLDAHGYISNGDSKPKQDACLSCIEVQHFDPRRCCNTCQELKDAYSENHIPYYSILETAPQCSNAVGCQVVGDVLVSKVAGNVHIALGKSVIVGSDKVVHEFDMNQVSDGFNTSHAITRLEFGQQTEGMESPLEGTAKIVKHGAYMFHYFIQLVPTLFTARDGNIVYSHQYSVTDNEKNALSQKGALTGLPGVFFVYEFSPFLVQKIEKERPLSHFLISVCAIIGGVFTVAGMIDAMLWKTLKVVKRGQV